MPSHAPPTTQPRTSPSQARTSPAQRSKPREPGERGGCWMEKKPIWAPSALGKQDQITPSDQARLWLPPASTKGSGSGSRFKMIHTLSLTQTVCSEAFVLAALRPPCLLCSPWSCMGPRRWRGRELVGGGKMCSRTALSAPLIRQSVLLTSLLH